MRSRYWILFFSSLTVACAGGASSSSAASGAPTSSGIAASSSTSSGTGTVGGPGNSTSGSSATGGSASSGTGTGTATGRLFEAGHPCASDSQCEPAKFCIDGDCAEVPCGESDAGVFNGPCLLPGGAAGTCLPFVDQYGIDRGSCIPNGSSTTACADSRTANCVAGDFCLGFVARPDSGTCYAACDPNDASPGCAAPLICSNGDWFGDANPQAGVCTTVAECQVNFENFYCGTNALQLQTCPCGLVCTDAGEDLCKAPCASTADCHLASESCQNGLCLPSPCGGDAGGTPFGPCVTPDGNPGTCFAGACNRNGSEGSTTTCDYQVQSGGCAAGYVCELDDLCIQVCDPADARSTCRSPLVCEPEGFCTTEAQCQLDNAATFPGDGVIACGSASPCPCGLVCAGYHPDAGDLNGSCALPCAVNEDCPENGEFCSQGACLPISCGIGDAGVLNGPCHTPAGPGTCLPSPSADQINSSGTCFTNGYSTTTCDSSPSGGCAAGFVCNPYGVSPGFCLQLCDSDGPPTCRPPLQCVFPGYQSENSHTGYCGTQAQELSCQSAWDGYPCDSTSEFSPGFCPCGLLCAEAADGGDGGHSLCQTPA